MRSFVIWVLFASVAQGEEPPRGPSLHPYSPQRKSYYQYPPYQQHLPWCSLSRAKVMQKDPPKDLTPTYKQIKDNPFLLQQAMKHPDPDIRYTAIYAIAVRKTRPDLPLLIPMTKDASPKVRLASRQALVIVSKSIGQKADFGPLDEASPNQIQESYSAWQTWLDTLPPPPEAKRPSARTGY